MFLRVPSNSNRTLESDDGRAKKKPALKLPPINQEMYLPVERYKSLSKKS
jgi:hypothetical protein